MRDKIKLGASGKIVSAFDIASVLAIVQLHGGKLSFHNAHPGLVARIWLPAVADV